MDELSIYFGNWMLENDEVYAKIVGEKNLNALIDMSRSGFGTFLMLAREADQIQQNKMRKIAGLIFDNVGIATFEGELGENSISFVKRYSKVVLAGGDSIPEIPYLGSRIGDGVYGGQYHMGGSEPFDGKFVLRRLGSLERKIGTNHFPLSLS